MTIPVTGGMLRALLWGMNTSELLTLARKHLGGPMESSARLCLSDALACVERSDYHHARQRALRSLGYSVGAFHADYQRADKCVDKAI